MAPTSSHYLVHLGRGGGHREGGEWLFSDLHRTTGPCIHALEGFQHTNVPNTVFNCCTLAPCMIGCVFVVSGRSMYWPSGEVCGSGRIVSFYTMYKYNVMYIIILK